MDFIELEIFWVAGPQNNIYLQCLIHIHLVQKVHENYAKNK